MPRDWTVDARSFCLAASEATRSMADVEYRFGSAVEKVILKDGGEGVRVELAQGAAIEADSVVLCCGVHTRDLVRRSFGGGSGILSFLFNSLPITGMKGCSIDLGGISGDTMPPTCVCDYSSGKTNFQLTPYEDGRARLVAFAKFSEDSTPTAAEEKTLLQRAEERLVGETDDMVIHFNSRREMWCGRRFFEQGDS